MTSYAVVNEDVFYDHSIYGHKLKDRDGDIITFSSIDYESGTFLRVTFECHLGLENGDSKDIKFVTRQFVTTSNEFESNALLMLTKEFGEDFYELHYADEKVIPLVQAYRKSGFTGLFLELDWQHLQEQEARWIGC